MPTFETGVSGYIHATVTVKVSFPIDWRGNTDVKCAMCPYYGRTSQKCHLNGSIVEYPEKYIGSNCPLTFED